MSPLDAQAVRLPEAARIAGMDPDTFAWLVMMMSDHEQIREDDRITTLPGINGPLFIASECRALRAILGTVSDGIGPEGGES